MVVLLFYRKLNFILTWVFFLIVFDYDEIVRMSNLMEQKICEEQPTFAPLTSTEDTKRVDEAVIRARTISCSSNTPNS